MSVEFLDVLGRSLQFIGWAFLPILLLPALVFFTGRARNISSSLVLTIDAFIALLGEAIKWVMPLLVTSVVIGVFALSIYGVSSIWWDESAIYLHAIGICLGVAPTYLAGQHVKVDILYDTMSSRSRALVEVCGFYGFLVPVCVAVLWRSQSFISFAWQSFEGSTNNGGIQGVFILKTALSVMFLMLLIQGLSVALRASLALRNSSDLDILQHSKFAFLQKSETGRDFS